MLVKNINETTKKCNEVFVGTDFEWALSQGFEEHEVEQSFDGQWYLVGFAPQEPLDALKCKKWADIQRACDTYRETATCKVGEMYFSISEQAKINLTSVVLMGQVIGSVQYFEKSGIKHTFTIAEFMPIATAIGQAIAAAESKYYEYETAITNATTKEQLDLIQWGDA